MTEIKTYTRRDNAVVAAKKLLAAGNAPAIDFHIQARKDGRHEIVWHVSTEQIEVEIAAAAAAADDDDDDSAEQPTTMSPDQALDSVCGDGAAATMRAAAAAAKAKRRRRATPRIEREIEKARAPRRRQNAAPPSGKTMTVHVAQADGAYTWKLYADGEPVANGGPCAGAWQAARTARRQSKKLGFGYTAAAVPSETISASDLRRPRR